MPETVGAALGMNATALLKQASAATRQLIGFVPVLALLLVCLTVSPTRQFDVQRTLSPVEGEIDHSLSLPSNREFAALCQSDILRALEFSLLRYEREITDYRCMMIKQERINGKLRPTEEIQCAFRQEPFSVMMEWVKGADRAGATLFVQGENRDQLLVRPASSLEYAGLKLLKKHWVERDINDKEVLEASRYTVKEFGLERGCQRTYTAWKKIKEQGRFFVEYLGEKPIAELDGRICHLIKRTCNPPEEDGMTEITIMLDRENWQQVGSVLKAGDDLIGSYFFKAIEFKPNFPMNQFRPEILIK